MVKLLEQHGADLHRVYPYGDGRPINALSMAIDWSQEDVAEYLRSKGAVLPDEEPTPSEPQTAADEVVTYFTEHFGPVRRQAIIEIVPTEPRIAVHVVPASEERNHLTLFTTGMSDQAMEVPDGGDEYRFAELFIQLPADWKYMQFDDPNFGWPVNWLRSIAQQPPVDNTWLGGPVAVITNDDPPERLAPNTEFASMLLMAERHVVSADGRKIQLYRLAPLYAEERDLEMREDISALLRAFDRHSIPFVVDLSRPNVATI